MRKSSGWKRKKNPPMRTVPPPTELPIQPSYVGRGHGSSAGTSTCGSSANGGHEEVPHRGRDLVVRVLVPLTPRPLLEEQDLPAGFCQTGGKRSTAGAAADHDCIVHHGHQPSCAARQNPDTHVAGATADEFPAEKVTIATVHGIAQQAFEAEPDERAEEESHRRVRVLFERAQRASSC